MIVNYEMFKRVFYDCEKMPTTKDEFIKKLYDFWKAGKQNREYEILMKLERFIKE